MRQFLSVQDVPEPASLVSEALAIKASPFANKPLGLNKCLGLVFLNPSLRTRMSTQRAAQNLGLEVMILNIDQDGWALETREGVKMDGTRVEHIRDAAAVMGQYCEILAVRSFARLRSREEDERDEVLNGLVKYSGVPVISLESAFLHPLQSLADLMTIRENQKTPKPRISLVWAPHVKALPQAVANSFASWTLAAGYDLSIAAPEGYALSADYTQGASLLSNRNEALEQADFVYVKNWSKFEPYAEIEKGLEHWMISEKDMKRFTRPQFMHCLPVRRDVELSSAVLDSNRSLVTQQALNRVYSAQAVLTRILKGLS